MSIRGILFVLLSSLPCFLPAQAEDTVFVKSLLLTDRTQETSAAFLPDGSYLYFSRKGAIFNFGKDNSSDIWRVKASSDGLDWTAPVNAGPQINSAQGERVVSLNAGANRLYFSRKINDQERLFVTEKTGRRWQVAQSVRLPGLDSFARVKSYFVSPDEQVLLCCAVPSGQEQADIYFCLKNTADEWTAPSRLPLPMNPAGDELSVFLAADNRSLYFASNGPQPEQNYDLYYTKRMGPSWQNWSAIQSLGPEINTSANEYGLTMPLSGKIIAYISDVRSGQTKVIYARTPKGFLPEANQ